MPASHGSVTLLGSAAEPDALRRAAATRNQTGSRGTSSIARPVETWNPSERWPGAKNPCTGTRSPVPFDIERTRIRRTTAYTWVTHSMCTHTNADILGGESCLEDSW